MQDPRSDDLIYDSAEWTRLLQLAEAEDPNLAGILHGFRCCGLRLHRGRQGWALRPEYDPKTSDWTTEAEYLALRDQWLVPHAAAITRLLQQLGGDVSVDH
jgi:hypothetical protein